MSSYLLCQMVSKRQRSDFKEYRCELEIPSSRQIFQHEDKTFSPAGNPCDGDDWISWRQAWWRLARRIRRKTFLPRRLLPLRRWLALLRRWLQSMVGTADPCPGSVSFLRRIRIWSRSRLRRIRAGLWSRVRLRVLSPARGRDWGSKIWTPSRSLFPPRTRTGLGKPATQRMCKTS